MELLPYQQKWLDCEAPIAVMEHGRQIGISWAEAKAIVQGGGTYFATNIESVEVFLHQCKFWADKLNLAQGDLLLSKPGKAYFWAVGGKSITGSVYEEFAALDKSRVLKLDGRFVLDNFAFCKNAQEVWNLITASDFIQDNTRIRIISSHDGDKTLFHKLTTGKELVPGLEHHRVTLDDAITDGVYKKICESKGEEWSQTKEQAWRQSLINVLGDDADEELFCIPKKS